jgi:hypothetical protein
MTGPEARQQVLGETLGGRGEAEHERQAAAQSPASPSDHCETVYIQYHISDFLS